MRVVKSFCENCKELRRSSAERDVLFCHFPLAQSIFFCSSRCSSLPVHIELCTICRKYSASHQISMIFHIYRKRRPKLPLQGGFRHTRVYTNQVFMYAVVAASLARLLSNVMYQTALLLSPISLAVPYLAFNAVFLIVVAFFVVGEVPNWLGVSGVLVVALGGFLLSVTKSDGDRSSKPPGKKAKFLFVGMAGSGEKSPAGFLA